MLAWLLTVQTPLNPMYQGFAQGFAIRDIHGVFDL
jgi:hypothetical protein